MELKSRKSAVLLLEDGSIFEGTSLGKIGIATGEICFNTGMTGYQEIYTCLLYTSPSPRDRQKCRMPSSA